MVGLPGRDHRGYRIEDAEVCVRPCWVEVVLKDVHSAN